MSKEHIGQENKHIEQLSFSVSKAFYYSAIAIIIFQFVGSLVSLPALFYKSLNDILLPLGFFCGSFVAIHVLLKLTQTKVSTIIDNIKYPFIFIHFILAICCWIFFLPLSELLTKLIPTDEGVLKKLYEKFTGDFDIMLNYKFASFFTICILAPIFEEIIFRGIILKGMLNYRVKPLIAILVSGFIFGIAHMNPWQFIGAGILGTIFGFIYYRTNSLLLPIILHFINNLFSYIIFIIYNGFEVEIFSNNFYFLMSTIILGICSLFVIYKCTKNYKWN